MEGCRRRLIPGSIPTIRKIAPGKESSKRVSHEVLFFVTVSYTCLFPDISAICKYIFKLLIKFSIVHIAALLYFSFLSLLFIPVMWRARKMLVYRRAFQWFSNQP